MTRDGGSSSGAGAPGGFGSGLIERRVQHARHFVRSRLLWGRLYRISSYLRSSLWLIPFLSFVAVIAFAPVLRALDAWLGWRLVGLEVSGAQALFQTVITLTLSFVVFTFGSLLVAIQVAGGQLTPRIIATILLSDNVVRWSVGLFTFSLALAVTALNRLEDRVPELVALVTIVLGVASIAVFLFLIDYAARLLRPVSVLAHVGDGGLAVIETVYPDFLAEGEDESTGPRPPLDGSSRIVSHVGASEVILAVDLETLVAEAGRQGGVIELVPQVGDFVADGEALFELHGGAVKSRDEKLRATVAFGRERTMEQDPIFAFRILADIALKALSPAINDPTTAVLALDQLHRLLRSVGRRYLQGETIEDDQGAIRVVYRTPNWDDFVHVSCQEIRSCGASNVQVARRLHAIFEDLLETLPSQRHESLRRERARLDQAIETSYPIADDRELARVPDSQGLGGTSASRRARR